MSPAPQHVTELELDELEADLGRQRLRRDVELLGRQRRETALVVGDPVHSPPRFRVGSSPGETSAWSRLPTPVSPPPPLACPTSCSIRESARSPCTMPSGPVHALLLDEVEERARLLHALGDVRREGRRHLAVLEQAHGELHLLDRGDDALRLRHELGLAQPAGRLRGGDEPVRVLRAHVLSIPACIASAPSFAIASRGSTPLGQRSLQK